MNNLWFNIRFGTKHWQWGPDGMSWEENAYHRGCPHGWFAIYTFFGFGCK